MRRFLIAGGLLLLICLGLALVTLRFIGFEPRDRSPGLWVVGELVTTPITDWSFTDQVEEISVETRTWYFIPHSVTTFCTTYNGQLYLTSTYSQGGEFPEAKLWNRNVVRDPRVRLKIGSQLYERRVALVTDPAEKEAVLQSKWKKYPHLQRPESANIHVLRTEPR